MTILEGRSGERRGRRRAGGDGSAARRASTYRHLVNPFEPLRVFSDDHIEAMHRTALRILEELGMRVLLPEARRILAAAGATVDEESRMVRFDRGLVEDAAFYYRQLGRDFAKTVIRDGKTHQIYSLMQVGQKFGMQTMNQALLQAVLDKSLSPEHAMNFSTDRQELEGMLAKVLRAAA